jgi:hypothetical protein
MVLLYNLKNKRFVPARNVVSKEREDEQEIHMLFYQFFLTKKLDLNDYNISPNLSLFTRDTLVMWNTNFALIYNRAPKKWNTHFINCYWVVKIHFI